ASTTNCPDFYEYNNSTNLLNVIFTPGSLITGVDNQYNISGTVDIEVDDAELSFNQAYYSEEHSVWVLGGIVDTTILYNIAGCPIFPGTIINANKSLQFPTIAEGIF
ncbi:33204_t:CDS:1, partial [Racocetra persica]